LNALVRVVAIAVLFRRCMKYSLVSISSASVTSDSSAADIFVFQAETFFLASLASMADSRNSSSAASGAEYLVCDEYGQKGGWG
jgi:hypothetical protein